MKAKDYYTQLEEEFIKNPSINTTEWIRNKLLEEYDLLLVERHIITTESKISVAKELIQKYNKIVRLNDSNPNKFFELKEEKLSNASILLHKYNKLKNISSYLDKPSPINIIISNMIDFCEVDIIKSLHTINLKPIDEINLISYDEIKEGIDEVEHAKSIYKSIGLLDGIHDGPLIEREVILNNALMAIYEKDYIISKDRKPSLLSRIIKKLFK